MTGSHLGLRGRKLTSSALAQGGSWGHDEVANARRLSLASTPRFRGVFKDTSSAAARRRRLKQTLHPTFLPHLSDPADRNPLSLASITGYIAAVHHVFLVRPSAGPLSHLNQADSEQRRFTEVYLMGPSISEAVALLIIGGGDLFLSSWDSFKVLSSPDWVET